MKVSTRARYGLRMMIELAREAADRQPVHLGKIASTTGLSDNYLAQLAMSLKNDGLLIGVSGKHGGYMLARPAAETPVGDIVKAVIGPINLTECVENPDICLNSSFCESRSIWTLINYAIQHMLEKYTLADLTDKNWMKRMREEYPGMALLNPDNVMAEEEPEFAGGCPVSSKDSSN